MAGQGNRIRKWGGVLPLSVRGCRIHKYQNRVRINGFDSLRSRPGVRSAPSGRRAVLEKALHRSGWSGRVGRTTRTEGVILDAMSGLRMLVLSAPDSVVNDPERMLRIVPEHV
jgi:hypothetical protein